MKPIHSLALLGALSVAAQAAVTDPVGFVTHTLNGKGVASQALTITGPTLVNADAYVGTTTGDPGGGTVFALPSGVPTTFGTGDLLEITSGAFAGWWSTVISSTDTSVTVNDTVPAVGGVVDVAVRPHITLLGFLGDNNPGLSEPTSPAEVPTSDQVQFLNPDQSLTSHVYLGDAVGNSIDGQGAGWFTTAFARADDSIILPGTAVLFVIRSSTTDLTFTSTGDVKLTPTDIDVYPGLTLVTQTDAVGASLIDTGFSDDFITATAPSDPFDRLQFLSPVDGSGIQALTSYGVAADGVIGPGLNVFILPSFANSNAVAWAEAVGAIVLRDAGQAAGTITIEGSTVGP